MLRIKDERVTKKALKDTYNGKDWLESPEEDG
jgi:hypothetical protein